MTKLSKLCFIEKGKTPIQNSESGDYPLVVTSEERLTCNTYQFNSDAVCIPMVSSTGHGHASLKRIHFQTGKFALGSILCAVISKDERVLKTKYLYIYLHYLKDELLVPLMKGSANVGLSLKNLGNLNISIPDIEAQEKILTIYENIEKHVEKIEVKLSELKIRHELIRDMIMQDVIKHDSTRNLKMNDLFNIEKGSLQSSKSVPGEYDFLTASESWKTHNEYTHDCEAVIFAMGASGSLGRTHYVNGRFISSDLCFILTPKIDLNLEFYNHLFRFERQRIVKETATGTSKLAINQKNFSNCKIAYIDKTKQLQYLMYASKIVKAELKIYALKDLINAFFAASIDKLLK